ncbi:MAG: ABC transporter permease [Nanoarchaeota archaeon]
MLKDYLMYSLNNLKRRRLRSWLTMLGIFIGIATIVTLIALGEGLESVVVSQFGNLGPDVITVSASSAGFADSPSPLTAKDLRAVERISGVEGVAPRHETSANLFYSDYSSGTRVVSIPDEERSDIAYEILSLEIEEGNLLEDSDRYEILLGYGLAYADKYRKPVRVGDTVTIKDVNLEVAGILKKTGSFSRDFLSYMNEDIYEAIFDEADDEFSVFGVLVRNEGIVDRVADDIGHELRKTRDVTKETQDFSVQTSQEALEQLESILFAVQLFLYIIAGISILVGGIGIANTMYTSVLERTKEVGIMKAIGATNGTIFSLFFIESGLLGMVGGLIGIALGYGLGSLAETIGQLAIGSDLIQAHFSFGLLGGALRFSFLLGSLSGLLPAMQAATLHPVDALRKR